MAKLGVGLYPKIKPTGERKTLFKLGDCKPEIENLWDWMGEFGYNVTKAGKRDCFDLHLAYATRAFNMHYN